MCGYVVGKSGLLRVGVRGEGGLVTGLDVEVVWDKWSRVAERWAWVGGWGSSCGLGGLVWGWMLGMVIWGVEWVV